jgi:hypothetical protein
VISLRPIAAADATHSREVLETAFGLVDGLDPFLCFGEAALQRTLERLEVAVHLDNACMFWSANCSGGAPDERTSAIIGDLPRRGCHGGVLRSGVELHVGWRGGREVGAASLLSGQYDGTCFSSSYLTTGHEQSPGTASENSFAGSCSNC